MLPKLNFAVLATEAKDFDYRGHRWSMRLVHYAEAFDDGYNWANAVELSIPAFPGLRPTSGFEHVCKQDIDALHDELVAGGYYDMTQPYKAQLSSRAEEIIYTALDDYLAKNSIAASVKEVR